MINLHESMGLGRDRTRDPRIKKNNSLNHMHCLLQLTILLFSMINEKRIFLTKFGGGIGIGVLRPANSYGHMETRPRSKISPKILEKPQVDLTTPGLQGEKHV